MHAVKPLLAIIEAEGADAVSDRLTAKSLANDKTGCREWAGTRDRRGYGFISIQGQSCRAHRVAMVVSLRRELDPLEVVCHACDNPPCVNIDHLWVGTTAENTADMCAKGRKADHRGEQNPRAKLAAEQVRAIRSDPRGHKRLARQYGVHRSTIQDIRNGTLWSSIA